MLQSAAGNLQLLPLCACCSACCSNCVCYVHLKCCLFWLQQRLCSWQGLIGPATHLCAAGCMTDNELKAHFPTESFAVVSAQHPQNGQQRALIAASTVRDWSSRVAQQADCCMSSMLYVIHLASIVGCCSLACPSTVQHTPYIKNLFLHWHVTQRAAGGQQESDASDSLPSDWQPSRKH